MVYLCFMHFLITMCRPHWRQHQQRSVSTFCGDPAFNLRRQTSRKPLVIQGLYKHLRPLTSERRSCRRRAALRVSGVASLLLLLLQYKMASSKDNFGSVTNQNSWPSINTDVLWCPSVRSETRNMSLISKPKNDIIHDVFGHLNQIECSTWVVPLWYFWCLT